MKVHNASVGVGAAGGPSTGQTPGVKGSFPLVSLRALILDYGFVIEREEWRRCGYTHNAASSAP